MHLPTRPVDLAKLRKYLRRLDSDDIFVFLDRALDELTPDGLARVVRDYIDLDTMRRTGEPPLSLLSETQAFHAAAIRGEFYETFNVNSRNYRDKSKGTIGFHAEFGRLMRRCLEAERAGREREIRDAFELLFDLMRRIDDCNDDIVFYADEGGAWQLCVQWPQVFEAWCPCLAVTATAEEYAAAVEKVAKAFAQADRAKVLEIARRWANADV